MEKALFTLKPLKPLSFRWGGEFTPLTKGPQAYSSSEPLPLPTGLMGMIAAGAGKYIPIQEASESEGCDSKCLHEKILERAVCEGECRRLKVRGPYILICKNGSPDIICFHMWKGKLLCSYLSKGIKIFEVNALENAGISNTGIMLSYKDKANVEGFIYSQTRIDYLMLLKSILRSKETETHLNSQQDTASQYDIFIAGELFIDDGKLIQYTNSLIRSGGEGGIGFAALKRSERTPLETMIMEISKSAGKPIYLYVSTPVILKKKPNMWGASPSYFLRNIVKPGLEISDELQGIRSRAVLGVIGKGFDSLRKRPRQLYPAIMPGAIFRYSETTDSVPSEIWKLFIEGLGEHSEEGWGTIIPI